MAEDVLDSGFGRRSASTPARPPVARRAFGPPLIAVGFLMLSYFFFGASNPITALFVSGCLILSAFVSLLFAGPRFVTFGMLAGALLIWAFGASGAAGDYDRAMPALAVLFAAGGLWAVGYVCARQRGALDIMWAGMVWSSFAYCAWSFFQHIANAFASAGEPPAFTGGLATPIDAAVLFGLFALLGASRVLHVIKRADAEALSRSTMVDRLFSDALGGLLLLGFALTCLVLTGSRVGMLFTASVLLMQTWWDTLAITQRDHRSAFIRWLARATPLIAISLAGLGVGYAFVRDETLAHGIIVTETQPRLDRLQVYFGAWLEKPVIGHGLGSIEQVRDHAMTLFNVQALSAPGDAQNVLLHWLVEAGVVGAAALILTLAAIHFGIFRSMASHKSPRTFMRLALGSSTLLLLHGLTDSSLDLPSVAWLYALVLGAACGVATGRRKAR